MYDKHSDVQNYAHYPVELRENERVAYGTGVVADSFTPPPGREEPLSHAHYFGMGTRSSTPRRPASSAPSR